MIASSAVRLETMFLCAPSVEIAHMRVGLPVGIRASLATSFVARAACGNVVSKTDRNPLKHRSRDTGLSVASRLVGRVPRVATYNTKLCFKTRPNVANRFGILGPFIY